jgi:hypothetical protein
MASEDVVALQRGKTRNVFVLRRINNGNKLDLSPIRCSGMHGECYNEHDA